MSFLIEIRTDANRYSDGHQSRCIKLLKIFSKPGFIVTLTHRLSNIIYKSNFLKIFYPIIRTCHWFISFYFGIEIPRSTTIGEGFCIKHSGGIAIHSCAVIGRNCTITHGVTIGIKETNPKMGVPIIGDNVYFGAGCVVIGGISIGANAKIGANAVVMDDIPEGATAVGVPAKIIVRLKS